MALPASVASLIGNVFLCCFFCHDRSLIDTVYALRDQVNSLMDETKSLKKDLDQERKARRKLESSVRKSMKSMDFKALDL